MPIRFLTEKDKEDMILTPTDSKYFDIDYDGIICLKPEYRGHPANTTYPYAVSDNGINVDGSLINELPERIVIPDSIGKTAVSGFAAGMFSYNYRVKEIVLPDGVTELPESFCRYAINLKAIHNTESVTKVGKTFIAYTSVEKALFPNLTDVVAQSFGAAGYLKVVDIGNNITEIPKQCFLYARALSVVKGGAKVTKIGEQAFDRTVSLKNLLFLPQVTELSKKAFYLSRIQFDWSLLSGKCTFGDLSTPVIDNTVDWSGITFTACEHTLNTLMSQSDPRWTNLPLGETGKTYNVGCATFCILHIHSALSGKTYSHPDEFVEEVKNTSFGVIKDGNNPASNNKAIELLRALGYKVTPCKVDSNGEMVDNSARTKADYQALCDALARGAYVFAEVSNSSDVNDRHAVVLYGINEIGEVLIADSAYGSELSLGEPGINRNNFVYRMPYLNTTGPNSDFIIVEKQ